MKTTIDGKAIFYADNAFNTPNGKTAHGLLRFTERYEIVGILDHKYDGFHGYVLHPTKEQINAIETISGKKVIAVTVNHEDMTEEEILPACTKITEETGLPAYDVLEFGVDDLVDLLKSYLK